MGFRKKGKDEGLFHAGGAPRCTCIWSSTGLGKGTAMSRELTMEDPQCPKHNPGGAAQANRGNRGRGR